MRFFRDVFKLDLTHTMYKHEDSRSTSISSLFIAKKKKEKENSSYFLACPAYSYELTLCACLLLES